MELSFAYAPPLIISAAVSNKVFDSLEDGAKTPPYVPSATAPRGWRVPVLFTVKRRRRAGLSSAKNAVCQLSRHRRHRASEAAWETLCASTEISCHPFGPIFVGGVKQFSVASTVVEAHLGNKSPISSVFLSILCRRFNNRA